MWKSEVGKDVKVHPVKPTEDDDWDTSEDVKPVSEKQQRWAGGREVQVDVPLKEFTKQVVEKHDKSRINEYSNNSFSRGYGGKYGVETRSINEHLAHTVPPAGDAQGSEKQKQQTK